MTGLQGGRRGFRHAEAGPGPYTDDTDDDLQQIDHDEAAPRGGSEMQLMVNERQ